MWTTVNKLDGGKNEIGYAAFQRHETRLPVTILRIEATACTLEMNHFIEKKNIFFRKGWAVANPVEEFYFNVVE